MEHGFFHPERGYWQTVGGRPAELPEGTVEVPLKPGAGYHWRDGAWVFEPEVIDYPALDQSALNEALTAQGSVVRSLGLLLLDTINRQNLVTLDAVNELRTVAGLPAYSVQDFRNALASKDGIVFYSMEEFVDALGALMRD